MLGEAHLFWQDDSETIEESGLCRAWLGHAAQAKLAMRCGRQNDVLGLNAFEGSQGTHHETKFLADIVHGAVPAFLEI